MLGGRSGSFIFYSDDKRFLIKTVSRDDLKAFLDLENDYFKHLRKNPRTLLARIYGFYKVIVEE